MATEVAPSWFPDLWSDERAAQNAAFNAAMEATKEPVDWAPAVWGEVLENLRHDDNHNRAIASQVLCNLASHDPAGGVLDDLDDLIAVTRDGRFVTARHCLQSLWKIGLAGPSPRRAIVEALERRYDESAEEKNGTLIRNDIVVGLRKLYDATDAPEVVAAARRLVDAESDPKYRAKYAKHWKGVYEFDSA